MTKQTINTNSPDDLINVGNSANDRRGDSLRAAFIKLNDAADKIDANFTELYAQTGGAANLGNLTVTGSRITSTDVLIDILAGDLNATYSVINVADNTANLYSENDNDGDTQGYSWISTEISDHAAPTALIEIQPSDTGVAKRWAFDKTGTLTLPADGAIGRRVETPTEGGVDAVGAKLSVTDTTIALEAYNDPVGLNNKQYGQVLLNNSSVEIKWAVQDVASETGTSLLVGGDTFSVTQGDGVLNNVLSFNGGELSTTGDILQKSYRTSTSPAITVNGGATGIIFTGQQWMTSIKLLITVEGRIDGDITGVDHTQTCEATIAASYNTSAEPVMSVYGSVYTSVAPLATFAIQRGAGNTIEVMAINSQATNSMRVKVHAIQVVSYYD